jgi:hypothetical protein
MEIPRYIRAIVQDRRLAAIHEAGHVVIARTVGMFSQAEIYPTYDSRTLPKGRYRRRTMWTGMSISTYGKRRGRLILPNMRQARMISVAGAIAETYWWNRKRIRSMPPGQQIDWAHPDRWGFAMSESSALEHRACARMPSKKLMIRCTNTIARLERRQPAATCSGGATVRYLQTWKRLTPKNDSHKPETPSRTAQRSFVFDYSSEPQPNEQAKAAHCEDTENLLASQ